MQHKTILGIDPGTKEMGMAVIRGPALLAYGVHTLRNGTKPYDVIGQARRIVLSSIARHQPQIVAIEEAFNIATRRGHLMNVMVDELHARAGELGLEVVALSPLAIRERLMGNPSATKLAVAEILVRNGFPQLQTLIPKRPIHSALGLPPKDKYWLHMFDALALARAVQVVLR